MNSPIPKKLSVRKKGNRTILSYDKYDPSSLVLLPVLLYVMGTILVGMFDFKSADELLTAFLVLAIPGYGSYMIADHSFNSTNVSMDRNRFVIYDSPIPTRCRQVVKRKGIKGVSTKTYTIVSSEFPPLDYYSVSLVLFHSPEVTIFQKINDKIHAKAIQKIIEEELNASKEFAQKYV
ncbi:hypothetical protein [Leptospira adleri]|uniref:Uncharacterized protein n=1 Tax=Leptospira adleri TaxID=2023186 RepID=A0A2M9YMF7_9LEPT|nr:hypothetical protein [Leptospira adleri]PJZ52736.1 hypothetical protein CH380_13350 [Leptospira adleri]PJZ61756.1 hypothetical protein CH376_11630 [Leptospira adleri]